MTTPIIDLHCDLLAYLQLDRRKNAPLNEVSNCSIPLLEQGNVRLQTLALWTETKSGAHRQLLDELVAYHQMLNNFPDRVGTLSDWDIEKEKVHFVLAIENASGLLEEEEPLELLEKRLGDLIDPVFYVTLTWNDENRFGGGSNTQIGLKRDGEVALELLAEKKIAIDFSHTSDALADGIINYIHKKNLSMPVLVSHSNFRSILDCRRNLPDTIAKEIVKLGGIIGINLIRMFIGDNKEDFLKHMCHGVDLVGENALAIGGDIFGGIDVSRIAHLKPFFQEGLDTSACYPRFLKLLERELSAEQVKKIAYCNAEQLLFRQGLIINQEVKNGTPTP